MRFALFILLAFCWPCSHAEDHSQLILRARAAYEKYLPSRHFHANATAFGDVNGDGIDDFVTFIGDPDYNDNGVENLKAAVFLGNIDNTFAFSEATAEVLGNERVSYSLEIKRQSIFLHRDGSNGCCSHWVEKFQFKEVHGKILLIGLETAVFHTPEVNKSDFGTSTNLIAGKIQEWTETSKRSWGKARKVPGLAPVPLSGFDYEKFSQKWMQSR